jgi:hypothetical protein
MELKTVGQIVATRKLYLIGEEDKEISVLIGKPKKLPRSSDYYCPFQIRGIRSGKVYYAAGIDAIQAIQLAMKMIGALLYTSREGKKNKLRWEGDERGDLGLPKPD